MRKNAALYLLLALSLLHARPAPANTRELPRPLETVGFVGTLEGALARARSERKLVFLYLAPSWFESAGCEALERDLFASPGFAAVTKSAVPLRLAVDQENELLLRTFVTSFPALRVLDARGFLLATPTESTIAGVSSAIELARRREEELASFVRAADLTKPDVRAELVSRHAERGDFSSALAVYQGFREGDRSEARLRSLAVVTDGLFVARRFDEAADVLTKAEKALVLDRARVEEIRVKSLVLRIELACAKKDKRTALELLDDLKATYPEHPMAKQADQARARIGKLP